MHHTKIATAVALLLPALAQAGTPGPVTGEGQAATHLAQADESKVSSDTRVQLDIPAGDLMDALKAVARQTNTDLVYLPKQVAGLTTPGFKGELTPRDAIARLLKGTHLRASTDASTGAVLISEQQPAASAQPFPSPGTGQWMRLSRATAALQEVRDDAVIEHEPESGPDTPQSTQGIPEILVKGARTSNTDIRRTRDDVQPYVVFDSGEIGRSMAPDLETFLKTRLPMNQSRGSESQNVASMRGNQSTIDLRGLGADQTLILVDGRRMPGVSNVKDFYQPDVNGIPLSAIERIEILPSTAGGIYGGGATGGVVNIILKRDYNDVQMTARYDGTFAGGGVERRLDATAGFSLEGGRTNVMATASYRDGNPLYQGERDFLARARRLQNTNNHALYVSYPPLHGYTTNIKSYAGDLVLLDGMRSLGSSIAYVPVGYAGPASDNGAAFLNTADHYSLDLANDVFGNHYSLLNTPAARSLQISVRREFTDSIEAFVDASHYDNSSTRMGNQTTQGITDFTLPAGAPNNPFVQSVSLSVPSVGYDLDRLRTHITSLSEQLTGGVILRLPGQWTAQGEYSLAWSKYVSSYPSSLLADARTALIDGRLNPLADVNAYPLDFSPYYPDDDAGVSAKWPTEQKDATLRVSGPLLSLPGGSLRLAALLERREQYTADQIRADFPGGGGSPTYRYYPEVGSSTDSAYMELNAPLISAANARPGLQGFDLRASYRYDTTRTRTVSGANSSFVVDSADGPYPDVPFESNKVNGNQYTLGFRYAPVQSVALRVSYGEGILPPSPSQTSEQELSAINLPVFLGSNIDPKRGELPVDISTIERFTLGGTLGLRAEHSASWSAGVIFTPDLVQGLRLSVDYTRIEKTDEIGYLDRQTLLDLEDNFPGYIVRNELTPADAALGYTAGTIREFNGGQVNIARSLMESFDIQADYLWDTRFGSFAVNVMATVEPHLLLQAAPGGQEIEKVGYSDGPLKWRGNAGVRWSRGPWDLGWNTQYYDAARIYASTAAASSRDTQVLSQGTAWIPTQTYHDVYGRYRFGAVGGFAGELLDNTELKVSVQNVLNSHPPIVTSSSFLVGGYATEGDPRLRRYSIALTKSF